VGEVCVLENGDVGELGESGIQKAGRVRSGRVHVFNRRALPPRVLEERTAVAARGFVHLTLILDREGRLAEEIALKTRGVLDSVGDEQLLAAAREEVRAALQGLAGRNDEEIEDAAKHAARRALGRVLGFRPVTEATIVRVRS
jgi:ribonuclease J